MTERGRLVALVISLVLGAALGLTLASARSIAGDTAVTDPVWLGVMWFVRPGSVLVIVPPLVHLGVGALVGVLGALLPAMRSTLVVVIAVAINGAATLVGNGNGAGVVGVLWWLLGTAISIALMLVGVRIVRRAVTFRGRAPAGATGVSR